MAALSSYAPEFAAARVSLKQHRFEIVVAALVVAAVIGFVAILESRLDALSAPASCIVDWLGQGASGRESCTSVMQAWAKAFSADAQRVGSATSLAPFAIGLLFGVPLVARELELRTAQTAWSLNPSRVVWLVRQTWPIVISLIAILAVLLVGAEIVASQRIVFGQARFGLLDSHGPLLLIHAIAALAIGLLSGAIAGRTLPALLLACLVLVGVGVGIGHLRDQWVAAQVPTVLGDSTTAITVGWAWQAPDGSMLSDAAAKGLVPADVAAQDAGLAQAVNSIQWLEDRNYVLLPLGVSDEVASGWGVYDAVIYGLVALTAGLGSVWIVTRRRPT